MESTRLLATVLVAALATTGCAPADDGADGDGKGEGGGKADGWDYPNAPERFGVALTYRLDELPAEGRADVVPWSETYWPTTDDSFNARWQGPGQLSPLEKYDMAYNGWEPPPGFESLRPLTPANCASGQWDPEYYDALGPAARYWSDVKGNGRARNGIDDDGDGRVDECDDLDGMEYWWGSCHAWVPASLLEKEPLEPVTINGVRFEVSDIKALIILMYDEARQIAIGDRCNLVDPPRDDSGRIIDANCRNTNAGAFHVLVGSLIGLQGIPFGEDRVSDREVWNQPLAGYRVTRRRDLDAAGANAVLSVAGDAYPYNSEAVAFAEIEIELDYVVEAHPSTEPTTPIIDQLVRTDRYHYVLELDAGGNILGGEWVSARSGSTFGGNDRPDYLWLALGPGRMPNPHVTAVDVRELMRASRPDTRDRQVRVFADEVDQRIPDWPYEGVTRTVTVADPFMVDSAVVHVEVLHDWAFDVQVYLRRNGQELLLFDRNPVGSSTAVVGSFPVTAFNGQSGQGDWTLYVVDRSGRSIGRLVRWSLELSGEGDDPAPDPDPTPVSRTYHSSDTPIAVPDHDATGVASTLTVADAGHVREVRASVDIAHTYRGDLQVVLEHGGARQVLVANQGGAADDLVASFDAELFDGAAAAGGWTLRVVDSYARDVGTLNAWSLSFVTE